jgi:hypothetical protein
VNNIYRADKSTTFCTELPLDILLKIGWGATLKKHRNPLKNTEIQNGRRKIDDRQELSL